MIGHCSVCLPTLVYLMSLHTTEYPRPSLPCFCILQVVKNWTVGRSGNEARRNVETSLGSQCH